MKKLFHYLALATILVAALLLVPSCREDGDTSESPVENNNGEGVSPAVVNTYNSKSQVLLCDPDAGNYEIDFKGGVPAVKAGSVVIVKDGDRSRIVLVTKAKTDGSKVSFSGKEGDLRHVFQNTKFTLKLGDAESQEEDNDNVYYPVKSGGDASTKAKTYTLWDKSFSEDFTLWTMKEEDYPEWKIKIPSMTEEHASLVAHVNFEPTISAEISFEFGAPRNDLLDGVAFVLAGAYDVTVSVTGDLHSSIDFDFNYKMDEAWDGIVHGGEKPRYFFDKTELLKHDLFHKDFWFFPAGVPLNIHAGCNLMTEMKMGMHGEANLTFGVESDLHLKASAKVSPYLEQVVDWNKEFDFDWDGHAPTFSGHENVDIKWYLYPHLYFWVDYAVGPALDIKPYASASFGIGGKKSLAELQSYDDYITFTTDGYVGLDWAVGLSTPLEGYFYEADCTMKDLGNIKEWQFLKSPSGLILDNEPWPIKAGQPSEFKFVVLGDFYGKPATSWIPVPIKLDFPKSGKNDALFPILGKASYTWTPQFADDEMVARVFDINGNVVGQLQFRAAEGESIKAITGDVTDITSNTAILSAVFETTGNAVIDERGFCLSSTETVPKVDNSQKIVIAAGQQTYTVTGLSSNTKYYVRAFATNSLGTVYGNVEEFTTLQVSDIVVTSGELIDLGLSVKWASCNLGASKPEEGGGLYAWGELSPKSNYDWSTYRFGTSKALTKYCTNASLGTLDNKVTLELSDDAAYVATQSKMRMPTAAEWAELIQKCAWNKVKYNDVDGYLISSQSTGNSIFIPCNGFRSGTSSHYNRYMCYYWSSDLDVNAPVYAQSAIDNSLRKWNRYEGLSIRAVSCGTAQNPEISVAPETLDFGSVKIGSSLSKTVKIKNTGGGTLVFTLSGGGAPFSFSPSGNISLQAGAETDVTITFAPQSASTFQTTVTVSSNAAEGARKTISCSGKGTNSSIPVPGAVDLGLSVKWASFNLGASSPEEYGNYYAWGETEPKSEYSWSTYKWGNGYTDMTKYCAGAGNGRGGFTDNKIVLDLEDDAAHVALGGSWRMPTKAEQDELCERCTWEWTSMNGVNGQKVTAPNGNSIFLPAAGFRRGADLEYDGSNGFFWSSSLLEVYSGRARNVDFGDVGVHRGYDGRFFGQSVRPVTE